MEHKRIFKTIQNKYKITDFSDHKNVVNIFKSSLSDYSVRTYILSIISNIEDEELKVNYKSYIPKFSTTYNNKVMNNELTDNQTKSFISYNLLIDIYIFCHKQTAYKEALILALYLFFPPRRLEYCEMQIYEHKPKELNPKVNYYINRRKGYFIFNNYKTSRTFKTQYFEVPEDLDMIIKQYIYYEGKKDGDTLLPTNQRSNFVVSINNAIKKVEPNKKVSVQILRHSFLSFFHNNLNSPLSYTPVFLRNKKKSYKLCRQISRMMAHSIDQQLSYIKDI